MLKLIIVTLFCIGGFIIVRDLFRYNKQRKAERSLSDEKIETSSLKIQKENKVERDKQNKLKENL